MEGVELKEEWQDEDFPRYCVNLSCCQLWVDCRWFAVFLHVLKATDCPCLIFRPLPEEEELEDELFAHASEDQDTGNKS